MQFAIAKQLARFFILFAPFFSLFLRWNYRFGSQIAVLSGDVRKNCEIKKESPTAEVAAAPVLPALATQPAAEGVGEPTRSPPRHRRGQATTP